MHLWNNITGGKEKLKLGCVTSVDSFDLKISGKSA